MRTILLFTGLALLLTAGTAVAQSTDGSLGAQLTVGLYCDMKALFRSNVGLIVGLVVALMGLLKLIQGNTGLGILFILGGAAVTSLPSIIESFLGGVGSAVSGFSDRPGIEAPKC